MKKFDFFVPRDVKFIIEKIESLGYEAWCVGGAVRDTLLKKTPEDYDIATSMPPELIQNCFEKTVPTGIKHGTVTVIIGNKPYEVTRFRIDGEYLDHRKPESVEFTNDFALDLSRRDFTINAIGYNESHGIMDPFGGEIDLKNKIIRTVGTPEKRFQEDALRILRAVRFSAVLGFEIEPETCHAVKKMAHTLSGISAERIATELNKTLHSSNPSKIALIINSGGFKNFGITAIDNAEILESIPNADCLRLAVMLILCKCDANFAVDSLKLSREQKTKTLAFYNVLNRDVFCVASVKKLADKVPYDELKYLAVAYEVIYKTSQSENYKALETAAKNNEPYKATMLAISGDDLKSLGFSGKAIGDVQEKLLNFVLENPQKNTENELLKHIKD